MKAKKISTNECYDLIIDQDSKEKWHIMMAPMNRKLPKSFHNPSIMFSVTEKQFKKEYIKI